MNFSIHRSLRRVCMLAGVAAIAGLSTHALTIGGINFQDNAFADSLLTSFGTFTTKLGTTLPQALTDKDPGTYAFSKDAGAFVELGFTDNKLVNGPGADLALFELGTPPDTFILTINGKTISYPSAFSLVQVGVYPLNRALVNLDDFGVPSGAALHSIVIGLSTPGPLAPTVLTVPTLSLVGAINSANVPDGGSSMLCFIPVAGLLLFLRRGLKAA